MGFCVHALACNYTSFKCAIDEVRVSVSKQHRHDRGAAITTRWETAKGKFWDSVRQLA